MQPGIKERADLEVDAERYQLLVESITDYAVYMLDKNGFVASWNTGAQRFKGYEPSEIIGQHFSRFYTPEDQAAGLPTKALATATREGKFETEGWRVRKDGTHFWTHVVIDPIRDPNGELLGFAKITRDLTERRASEAKLKHSQEQFRLLVQGVTDYAIYMLDPKGHVASWNAGAQRIKGYLPEEIIGQHFSRFYGKEEREKGEPQRSLNVAAEVGRIEKEGWRYRKDGSRFWASVIIDRILDERGELIGFAKITRDVTEKREAQRQLETARESLFHAQKMEAVGQLTGGVAHDFNNLLMVILSTLELLRKRLPIDEKLTPLLENATHAAERGVSLTQRMLAFSRRQDLYRQAVELPQLVHGMSDLLQRSLGPSVVIETRFPLGLAKVHTDANQLESALLNLVVNARDAMPKGGSIIISAHEESLPPQLETLLEPGRYICFAVEDKGEGMDKETLSRATEPFFTTKGVGKGTGLGLSMVQGFTEQAGGGIVLRSEKGSGTTIEIWLPITEEDEREVPESASSLRKPVEIQKLVVLAVDDDPLVLMNTAAMLEDLGHTVMQATSGDVALNILKQAVKIDLVITDQAMPKMTGTQLAEAIKEDWPKVPIMLATGYADIEDKPGMALPRLSKPFTQRQLSEAMAQVIQAKSFAGRVLKFFRPPS